MVKKIVVIVFLIPLSCLFFNIFLSFTGSPDLNETSLYYAKNVEKDVGVENIVSAVVVTYRGLDTLGELTILFLAATITAFLLRREDSQIQGTIKIRESSELLDTAVMFITPIILLMGAYVFLNGHASPGGGFQGGAILASGLVLMLMAKPLRKVNKSILNIIQSTSGVFYIIIGVLGIVLAGGFLDNKIFAFGEFGTYLKAGSVPLLEILIGFKVGAELSNILTEFQERRISDDQF